MTRADNDFDGPGPLHVAAADGDLELLRQLVAKGHAIDAFDDDLAYTPLHYAARAEHIDVVEFLLRAGADVNARDSARIGETPLGAVAQTCSYRLAQILVGAGADPTIPGWTATTALDRARRRLKPEGRKVYDLLERTAKKTTAAKPGRAPR